jgi:hypothetical protein
MFCTAAVGKWSVTPPTIYVMQECNMYLSFSMLSASAWDVYRLGIHASRKSHFNLDISDRKQFFACLFQNQNLSCFSSNMETCFPVCTVKAYWSRGLAPLILSLDTRRGEWLTSLHGSCAAEGWVWKFWREENSLAPTGILTPDRPSRILVISLYIVSLRIKRHSEAFVCCRRMLPTSIPVQ